MKIFVGGLSFDTQSEDLRKIFGQYGRIVSAQVVVDRMTYKTKGFGFVEMEDQRDAKDAINELNGSRLYGKSIVVRRADQKRAV